MRVLIWVVFLAFAVGSRYFFGSQGSLLYFVVVFVAIVLFRRQLTIGLTHVVSKLGLMKGTIDRMPMSIRLVKAEAIDEAARPMAAALSRVGFVDAGAWNIFELPKIRLELMVHPAENFLGAIETASAIGAQLNVHTLYSNGTVTTVTNSRLPVPRAKRPGWTRVGMPGASPGAVFSRARAERLHQTISEVTAEKAPELYERLYAESILYQKTQGA